MMDKKIRAFCLCVFLGASLAACSGTGSPKPLEEGQGIQDTQEAPGTGGEEGRGLDPSEEESQEGPAENAAMTDEELLEALGDNINIVADDGYAEMVNAFLEHTDDYVGQLYQLTGSFVKEGEDPYLSKGAGEGGGEVRIPLKCLTKEPEEGAAVRITGIVNYGEIAGETVPVLDVAVLETLDGQ